jgi:uncharacterized membrane protein YagU involved in acid resistance
VTSRNKYLRRSIRFRNISAMASSTTTLQSSGSTKGAVRAVLFAGLTVGVLDTLLAMGLYRVSPFIIYQSIAGGFFGRSTYQHGWATAALGCFLHFFIATTAAAVYVGASRYLHVLVKYAVVCGMAYGAVVYAFMNYVVIPVSAITNRPKPMWELMGGLIGHIFLVGLPIGLMARRASSRD